MPREYGYEDMEELLEGLGFQQVDITEKFRWRNRNGWSFSAALANQQSMVEAKADDGTVVAISEVRFVATDKLRKRCTTLPQERVTSFKRHQPNSCSVPDAPEAAMGVESEGLAEHKEGDSGAKRPGGSESAPSKRASVGPPDGFVKISSPGGGNCLFHAVAKAVEDEENPERICRCVPCVWLTCNAIFKPMLDTGMALNLPKRHCPCSTLLLVTISNK